MALVSLDSLFQVNGRLAVHGSLAFGYSFHSRVRFRLRMNAPVSACLIPDPLRCCTISGLFWLKMSSCNEHLAIRLMPLLARCVPWKHILHVMKTLIRGTYNPYSFCLVEVKYWHSAHLIAFSMSDLKDISKRGVTLILSIYFPLSWYPSTIREFPRLLER